MTETQETIGTVVLMGAPLAVIAWPWLPLAAIQTAAAVSLSVGFGVTAYLATHWLYGFYSALVGR